MRIFAAGKSTAEHIQLLAGIERRVHQARVTGSPKTIESLDLMSRAINDIRKISSAKR
jgi:hypothetical protein